MATANNSIIASPFPDQSIPEQTVTAFALARIGDMPDAVAFIDGASGKQFTYQQLSDSIHETAGGLAASGVGPGVCVALMCPNRPEFAIVFHAVAVAGGIVTTINPAYGADEVRHQLNDASAVMLITVPDFLETARRAIEGTPVSEIVCTESVDDMRSLEALREDPIAQVSVDLAGDTVVLPYSSGTTGLPKGVMLTHRNLVANLVQSNTMLDYEVGGTALAVLPFFHIYGMQLLMNSLLAEGKTVVTLPRFDLKQVLTLVQTHGVAYFYIVPPIALALARHPMVDEFDISSLQYVVCAAAPLGSDLQDELAERIGCRVGQGYGMTEMSPVSHLITREHYKSGSSGVVAPNTDARVVDTDGQDVATDEEGELWIRGPQNMKGYLNNAEATAGTLDEDGWLRTGDIVRVDADGHLFVVDRLKELIKFKGFQVAPAELEAIALTHPAVADVAVIGVPDDEAGEVPKAFVVLQDEQQVDASELQAHVAAKVANYKQIQQVEFVEEIPKSPSGKILRRLLRDGSATA